MKVIISHLWFVLVFLIILLYPVYALFFDEEELSGVSAEIEKIEMNRETLLEGEYQNYLNTVFENTFSGRSMLIHIRNQLLFSFLGQSPNSHVIMGKQGYLYEPEYINAELNIADPVSDDYIDDLIYKLNVITKTLQDNGKELYVFITPSKAHFCREFIPERYKWLGKTVEETNYDKLLDALDENKINYYDSIAFLETTELQYKSPYFYKSGIHWSHLWGGLAASNLLDYMGGKSKFDLSKIKIKEKKSDEPIYPDNDLYSTLNLMLPAKENWYGIKVKVKKEGLDAPNVLARGGSFMGQSISTLFSSGVFNEDIHIENNYYFKNRYSEQFNLSSHDAYDEMDLDEMIGNTDIIILEVNDAAIGSMSFGFIDYLYNHMDYLDSTY